MNRLRYIPELDGLRGLAILWVVSLHSLQLVPDYASQEGFVGAIFKFLSAGWMGVDLFFALSGFLITRLLLGEQLDRKGIVNFYGRRILRIAPAYFLVIGVSAVLSLTAGETLAAAWKIPAASTHVTMLLYVQNLTFLWGGNLLDCGWLVHTWSLAVEEHFYLLWPFAVAFVGRRHFRWLLPCLIVAVLAARLHASDTGVRVLPLYTATFFRIDALLLGCLVAILPEVRRRYWAIIFAAAVGAVIWSISGEGIANLGAKKVQTWGYTAIGIAAAATVAIFSRHCGFPAGLLRSAPLQWVGKVSYGTYLFHVPVKLILAGYVSERIAGKSPFVAFCLSFAVIAFVSFLLAAVSFYTFEKRVLSLKARWFPHREHV